MLILLIAVTGCIFEDRDNTLTIHIREGPDELQLLDD
jgi:hypothetical protein